LLIGIPQLRPPGSGPLLRIAFFSPELPSIGGSNGIITYCRIMRDALRDLGHSVMIVSASHVEHFDGRIAELPRPSAWNRLRGRRYRDNFAAILNAFDTAKACGAQVFEIEESFGWAGRLKGLPVVARLHGPNAFCPDSHDSRRETAEFASLRKVDAITSPSARLLDAVRHRYPKKLPPAFVIPNPMPSPAETWRLDSADPEQILFVGRFDKRKGADIAIEAFAKARERRPSLKMVMVGPGEPWMDIPPSVTVLGALSGAEVTALRLQSSLALSTSRFENFPYSLAEAMAIGSPVLAADSFGVGEMIRDGIDGRLVPVADADATAEGIVEMLADPSKLAKMGEAAALRVSEYMSPSRIASQTAELYADLCFSPAERMADV